MTTFLYELSTTGAISFSDFLIDPSNLFSRRISEATQARSRLRGTLKESKRTDDEKDYLTIIKSIDDYLPQLQSIMDCVAHGELELKSEPVYSWRTTLSASFLNNSPRLDLRSFHAEHACSLLTYAFALSNLARNIVAGLGLYERDRAISQAERETKEEKLKHATSHLCRASGIFSYLSETVLPGLQTSASTSKSKLPPDLLPEVNIALAKMSLADAQTLAIRKLLSKSFYDSNITPGPPLPKSHPAPGLIAKLHSECASLYSNARTLAKTPSASSKSSDDVSQELRHYLADEASLHSALAKKWLGIDAGENGGEKRCGDAVAFLIWGKKELQELKDGGKGIGLTKGDKEKRDRNLRKEKVALESETIDVWLKHYKRVNDTVHFQPIPSQADLQSRIPSGVSAVFATPYVTPKPAFGPRSDARVQKEQEVLDQEDSLTVSRVVAATSSSTYAGVGEYY
ncbi:BRO1 domain-containing protein [Lentinula aciculospora]|uniref:pH-response regulator protein palC n=1 Tax=Lentinula aciculospora TaxID=153920 RepID=A0A9W9DXK4_9AGAR|nr:BRO1 domain-containing protein [Lentinula aciculospora]